MGGCGWSTGGGCRPSRNTGMLAVRPAIHPRCNSAGAQTEYLFSEVFDLKPTSVLIWVGSVGLIRAAATRRSKSGRTLPQSKTWPSFGTLIRLRSGVRRCSAAFCDALRPNACLSDETGCQSRKKPAHLSPFLLVRNG